MRILLFLCLSTLLALGGYWVFAAAMIERQTAALLSDNSRLQGNAQSVTGFPLAFRTRIDAPSWRSQDGQRAWEAEDITLQAPSYRPNEIAALFPPVQQLRLGAAETRLTTDDMTARLVLTPDRHLRLAALEMQATSFTPPLALAALAAGQIELHWVEGSRYNLQASAEALRLSPEIHALLGPDDAALVEDLALSATADFTGPVPLQGPWPGLETLQLAEAHLAWGTLRLSATGQLARGAAGQIEGGFQLTVADWQALLALLQQLDILPPDAALMAGMLFAAQAEPGTNRLTLPLDLRDGMVWLGPVALVQLPAF